MGIENRPYVGTWRLGRQQVIQHTPDALVYLNGDVALPGCAACNSRINIQEFVTEVSVDAGTDPGSSSASFTLSVPVHHHESFARDAQFILRPGLEVHIYERGYFPVFGLYYGQPIGEKLPAYPYYHVFHGVVIQVSCSYSAGVQTFSVQCGSMLHFWQFQQVSTNASIFGARAKNSQNQASMVGHNYTGKHPYEIIWHIHNDFVSAAAGVGFALSSKTNQTAMYGEDSLYSLTAKYWEERFKTSTIRLRMHGASGQLFNAAQAAFLGRASSDELLRMTRSRFGNPNKGSKKDPEPSAMAEIRGSFTPGILDSLLFLKNASGGVGANLELNIVEMKAFISDIGQWGQVNFFESTYESKLDIANKVCEVTGFEFYQDVDGDFVFKPPFYNMDTSRSRTYRIEDIDIINITFDEKEPQVTYMTAKGGAMKNMTGTGAENEWGVRGQYIDYRLVAQYGWRPGDFETAYFNDASSMFFAAANRLDVMNAPSKSASVTIPLRPEIRPGFPVYIASLDCFYYCNSLSHSYVTGGQCTTTLQLIAKRAKFYAPGNPKQAKKGIASIQLGNTSFPPQPLTVEDNMGRPVFMGFPNVVMALDPSRIDPKMLLLGADAYDVSNPKMIPGIIQVAVDMGILAYPPGVDSGDLFVIQEGPNKGTFIYCQMDLSGMPDGTKPNKYSPDGNTVDATSASADYKKLLDARAEAQKTAQGKIDEARTELGKVYQKYTAMPSSTQAEQDKKDKYYDDFVTPAEKKIEGFQNAFNQAGVDYQKKLDSLQNNDPVRVIYNVMQSILSRDAQMTPERSQTNFMLSLLSDKKSMFTNGTLPGYYRYYSSSHPSAKDQGMPYLQVNILDDDKSFPVTPMNLEGGAVDGEGFMETGSQSPLNPAVNAKYGTIPVTRGIKVLTGDPNSKDGVILPTSEIRELMFAPAVFTLQSKRTHVTNAAMLRSFTTGFFAALLDDACNQANAQGTDTATLGDVFQPWLDTLTNRVNAAAGGSGPTLSFTLEVKLKTQTMAATDSAASFKLSGTSGTRAFPGSEQMNVKQFWQYVAKCVVRQVVVKPLNGGVSSWITGSSISQTKANDFFSTLYTQYGASASSYGYREMEKTKKSVQATSPVFPVSDARGYEVVGTYRYGRGVDIDENGVFADLVMANPLQRLDAKSVDDFVNNVARQKSSLSWARTQDLLAAISKQTPTNSDAWNHIQHAIQLSAELQGATDEEKANKMGELYADLRNWYMDSVKDGVAKAKIQLTNAAYTLADLKPASMQVCHCKMSEANIVLDTAQDLEFVPVVEGFMELQGQDPVLKTVAKAAAAAGMDWKIHQDALRGEVLDKET